MAKIFELNAAQEEILNALYWLDEDDADEIERLNSALNKIRGNAENTLGFLSDILLNLHYDESVCEDEEKRLKALADKAKKRKESAQKHAARLESTMVYICKTFDIKKVTTKHGTFAPSITPGALVYTENFDINALPDEFVELIPETKKPNGRLIVEALRGLIYDAKLKKLDPNIRQVDDPIIPGVVLVRKEGIRVK